MRERPLFLSDVSSGEPARAFGKRRGSRRRRSHCSSRLLSLVSEKKPREAKSACLQCAALMFMPQPTLRERPVQSNVEKASPDCAPGASPRLSRRLPDAALNWLRWFVASSLSNCKLEWSIREARHIDYSDAHSTRLGKRRLERWEQHTKSRPRGPAGRRVWFLRPYVLRVFWGIYNWAPHLARVARPQTRKKGETSSRFAAGVQVRK